MTRGAVVPVLRHPIQAAVIGASAGGVEVLSVILPSLPAGLSIPVFVVLHLARDRPSLLAELFADRCKLRVCEALDNTPIEGGVLYFAPPDYHLLIDPGPRLALSVDALVHYSRPSIDVLFESAADHYGAALLALLLTGANQDGARGLATVRARGGQTIVQEPGSALAAAMPSAALELGTPDWILDPPAMARLLSTLSETTL